MKFQNFVNFLIIAITCWARETFLCTIQYGFKGINAVPRTTTTLAPGVTTTTLAGSYVACFNSNFATYNCALSTTGCLGTQTQPSAIFTTASACLGTCTNITAPASNTGTAPVFTLTADSRVIIVASVNTTQTILLSLGAVKPVVGAQAKNSILDIWLPAGSYTPKVACGDLSVDCTVQVCVQVTTSGIFPTCGGLIVFNTTSVSGLCKFTATSTSNTLTYTTTATTSVKSFYSAGTLNTDTASQISSGGTFTISPNTVTVGQTVYLMMSGSPSTAAFYVTIS